MTDRNPKQEGSNVYSCRVQTGLCPIKCNQCFYNRDNGAAFYCDINDPHIPDPDTLPEGAIIRMNDGHDSSIHIKDVLEQAAKYTDVFFNTSRLVRLDKYPGPVVLTVNPDECNTGYRPNDINADDLDNIMYVRVRTTPMHLEDNLSDIWEWADHGIPVVITFMAYFDDEQVKGNEKLFTFKKRHVNSYWCLNGEVMDIITETAKLGCVNPDLVYTCGTSASNWCKDCNNCEKLYRRWQEENDWRDRK